MDQHDLNRSHAPKSAGLPKSLHTVRILVNVGRHLFNIDHQIATAESAITEAAALCGYEGATIADPVCRRAFEQLRAEQVKAEEARADASRTNGECGKWHDDGEQCTRPRGHAGDCSASGYTADSFSSEPRAAGYQP